MQKQEAVRRNAEVLQFNTAQAAAKKQPKAEDPLPPLVRLLSTFLVFFFFLSNGFFSVFTIVNFFVLIFILYF